MVIPAILPTFYVTLFGYVGLGTLVALGLVLLTGVSGQTSFGQASFVGIAAYATTLLTKFAGAPPIVGLVAGLLLTGAIAWLLGLVTARLSGHFLALVSVAWGISFFSLFGTLPLLRGFNGIGNIPPLSLGVLSAESLRVNLGVIWAAVALVMAMSASLLDSRIGRAIRTLNGARLMGESVGIDTVRLSRTVFVIAALYAGVAGFLFAHFQRFISPTPFSLGASIDYLFMVIIGGAGSLWGAPLGATLVVVLRDQFNDWIPRITGRVGDFELLVFSLVVIVLLQRAPDGLLPLLTRLKQRRPAQGEVEGDTPGDAPPTPPDATTPGVELLALESISRNFGGLAANRDVSFDVHASEIVALIGPNGAGKTTLFNVVSGVTAADLWAHPAVRCASGPSAAAARRRAGPRAHLPAREAAADPQRAGEHRARGTSVGPRRFAARDAAARSRRGSAVAGRGARPGGARRPGRRAGHAGRRPAAGPAARGGDRSRAVPASHGCCCWTSPPPGCGCRKSSASQRCCVSFVPKAWACCW